MKKHPGGSAVLLKAGGTDASQAFHAANHGPGATAMMRQYQIGTLIPGGYSQMTAEDEVLQKLKIKGEVSIETELDSWNIEKGM